MQHGRPVAVLGGVRIPFCRQNTAYADVGNLGLSGGPLQQLQHALVQRPAGAQRFGRVEVRRQQGQLAISGVGSQLGQIAAQQGGHLSGGGGRQCGPLRGRAIAQFDGDDTVEHGKLGGGLRHMES